MINTYWTVEITTHRPDRWHLPFFFFFCEKRVFDQYINIVTPPHSQLLWLLGFLVVHQFRFFHCYLSGTPQWNISISIKLNHLVVIWSDTNTLECHKLDTSDGQIKVFSGFRIVWNHKFQNSLGMEFHRFHKCLFFPSSSRDVLK